MNYRAALVGCSRMGAFIDNEMIARGDTSTILPYSHAATYEAHPRTELVAGSDLRPEVLEQFGQRYKVGPEHLYTDYREMIRREQPDIVSVATQAEQRAEVAHFAIDHGVRALYLEKPFCASLEEADRLVEAIERRGVAMVLGTNRRWNPGYRAMRDLIASGELGALTTLITYATGSVFDTASHWFDTLLYLGGDAPVSWVQAYLPEGDACLDGDRVIRDPSGEGTIAFADGVMAHTLRSARRWEHQAICEKGTITAVKSDTVFLVRRFTDRVGDGHWDAEAPLTFTPASITLPVVDDLVRALDTGGPTLGGARVARAGLEISFAYVASHRRGGARVSVPLEERHVRFDRTNLQARQPRYQVDAP